MEVRKTIVYIGNREDDSQLFEKAIEIAGTRCNYLALDNSYWTLRLLRKSLPFWYDSIILDMAKPSPQAIQFLKEIKSIRHLQHIPVIVYTDASVREDLNTLMENGATHYIPKPAKSGAIAGMFHALATNEGLPFMLNLAGPAPVQQNLRQAS
jgi:response regulator RpfG family c-di-GMP phosphodiesterase